MTSIVSKLRCSTCRKDCHPNFRICPNCGSLLTAVENGMPSGTQVHQKPTPVSHQATAAQPNYKHKVIAGTEWTEAPVAPWRRWAARTIDMVFNGLVMAAGTGVVLFSLAPFEANVFFSFLETPAGLILNLTLSSLLGCFLTGLVIGSTGSSIGKFLFGIRVTDQNGSPIGASAGLSRDLEIWVKGLGVGIPIVALFTQVHAYKNLKKTGTSSWDQGKYKVTYRANGTRQYILSSLGVSLLVILLAISRVISAI